MADSMCGPSNALQSFQKHSTVDRTLQQDRLTSRTGPSQVFRSVVPNTGVLDHEFESFQAGQLSLEPGFQPNTFQHAQPPLMQQPGLPNWASDFQRMNISGPARQIPQVQNSWHDQQGQDMGDWHQDFARQQMSERSMQVATHTSSPYQPQMLGMGSHYDSFAGLQQGMSVAQQKQPGDLFDETAFERAFDEAARAEAESMQEFSQQESTQNVELGQDNLLDQPADMLVASDDLEKTSNDLLSQERIGADTIHDPLFEDQDQPQNNNPEELARTAAKLLDSVQHDQSSKFQKSQFMSLMRQFRDREKTVEGDAVVSKNRVEETNQDIGDQKHLESCCDGLELLTLTPHRPFLISPFSVRQLLLLLVNIDSVFAERMGIGTLSTFLFSKGLRERMIDVLQAVLLQSWMMKLDSIQTLAASLLHRAIHPDQTQNLHSESLLAQTTLSSSHLTNITTKQDADQKIRGFIAACISQNKKSVYAAMLNALPYTIPEEQREMDIHFQRAKEVLGVYWDVETRCRKANLCLPGFSVDEVMEFMKRRENTEGGDGS